jgi:hypothetical protein
MRVVISKSQFSKVCTETETGTDCLAHTCCEVAELLQHETLILSPGHIEASWGKQPRNPVSEIMRKRRNTMDGSPERP